MKKYLLFIFLFLFTALFSKELYTNNLLKKINLKYGKYTENRFILLKKKINDVKNKGDLEKIKMVNDFSIK